MNLIPRNKCDCACDFYDSEESGDNWYQWCRHDDAEEEEVGLGDFYVVMCPLSKQSIEQD